VKRLGCSVFYFSTIETIPTALSQFLTDKELISSISNGNQDAFNLLYSRHWEDLYKYAFLILKDKDSCKDVIQDVFVWVWEHRKGLDMQSPKSYLKTAVKYKIANHIRTGNIRESFFEETVQFNPAQAEPGAAEFAEANELNHIIRLTVANLPVKCREIFRLSREENLSNREIASQLGISIKTVENQMTIALHRIRTNVEQHLTTLIVLPLIF
jgi:RNA polymerase sigma-70 factor (ECF subfamily)